MNARRVEITLSQEMWDRFELVRGREPRASFVRRALESALSLPGDQSPGSREGLDGLPVNAGGRTQPASSRASVPERRENVQVGSSPSPLVDDHGRRASGIPGVMTARELMLERQRKLNEGKG